jgi:tetratricopeptide (TPR) repeat protein
VASTLTSPGRPRGPAAAILVLIAITAVFALPGCSKVARLASAVQLATECGRLDDLGNYTQALKACSNSIKLLPTYPFPYFYRGYAYVNLGKNVQALVDYTTAVELDPSFQEAYTARGGVSLHLKDYRGAQDDAVTVERIAPDSARGYASECYVLSNMRHYDEALLACSRALKASKERRLGLSADIDLAARTGDWKRALHDSADLLAQEPDAPETYNVSCYLKIETNDFPGAAADCDKALELSHDEPHIRDTRAGLFFLQKRYPAAIADENSMIGRHPYAPYGYGGLCAIETELHRLKDALNDCTRAVSLDDANGEWLVLLGNVYRAQGDSARALAEYHRARAIDPSAFEALREEAQLDLDLRRAADARKLAALYVAKNPYDPVGHDLYGKALGALNDPDDAVNQFALAESGYRARSDTAGQRAAHLAMKNAQTATVLENR